MVQGVRPIDSCVCYVSDIAEVISASREVVNTRKEIVCIMGEIGESRSKETSSHVRRVAEYSRQLAIGYGLSWRKLKLFIWHPPCTI